jgi:anthranilate synthase/aminodeoxychorismate synthase-like glutamine amidotransferase
MRQHHVLMIDNYDSFTYNLVQQLLVLGARVTVRHNDEVSKDDAARISPTHLVVSPGPGRPENSGASMEMIEASLGNIPILGVCLGHQAIAAIFGATVGPAARLMHGKPSEIHHDGMTIFRDVPSPFDGGRYHSLAVGLDTVPAELEVSARTSDGEIMGLRHSSLPVEGVQFHPESVLTPNGAQIMGNFLKLSQQNQVLAGARL